MTIATLSGLIQYAIAQGTDQVVRDFFDEYVNRIAGVRWESAFCADVGISSCDSDCGDAAAVAAIATSINCSSCSCGSSTVATITRNSIADVSICK